jgi:hypothetical protein
MKKYSLCAGLILLLGFWGFSPISAQESNITEPAGSQGLHLIVCYGNLTGAGVGMQFPLIRSLSGEIIMGIESPVYLLLPPPYNGSTIHAVARLLWRLPGGLYLGAGGYAGYYELTDGLETWDEPVYTLRGGPVLSIGVAYPARSAGFQVRLEAGAVFNLPGQLTRDLDDTVGTYRLIVDRSLRNAGGSYPFFGIIVRI